MDAPVVAIVQARMGSTRLPGKVLAPVLGRPLLELMLERLARARRVDAVVVATSVETVDDPIADLGARLGTPVFRGPERDVLARFHGAAEQAGAGTVVRLTADCPLIDPAVVDRGVAELAAAAPVPDLVTNAPPVGRTYPDGMDVEVLSRATLDALHARVEDPADREHVTAALYRPPSRVHVFHLERDAGAVRITVDYAEDLARVRGIFETLAPADPDFTLDDVLALIAPA